MMLLSLLAYGLYGHDMTMARASEPSELQHIIDNKIRYYNERYPDIRFMHIDGGKDWHGELIAVLTMLGDQPVAMDYDHPPELRKDVIEVSIERLRRMLQYDIVSATLFSTGEHSLIERPYLCTITLNPGAFVADDATATQYMLDISDEVMGKVHPARYLDHREHLRFTLDHEAYHCIDSYLHGGVPMSQETLGGQYHLFRRESVADAYAMAMHIREKGAISRYARNITHFRAMWLFTDSPNRCTFETIREVLLEDPDFIRELSDEEIIDLAIEIRNLAVRPYQGYLTQRATALQAAKILGLGPVLYGEEWCECAKLETDPEHVGFLVNRYRYYYEQLFSNAIVPLEAPPLSGALQR